MSNLKTDKSQEAFKAASKNIPGGVDSPVRAFGAVGGSPLFIDSGKGSKIIDIDGNSFVDYVCSWGPLILGHADDYVIDRIAAAVKKGTSFGAPTTLETRLAGLIKERVSSVEKVRMVSSGTEAAMSAIRLARGFTGRDIVVKFDGCYHGHVDALLVKAGSGAMTFGSPTSPGIPQDYVKNTLVLPYNDVSAVESCCREYGKKIACIIVEPIAGNMGVVPPKEGYLAALRKITEREGIVLIFDEIISGFRVSQGGAQELYGIKPDLTTMGKIIGGGMPVGAYGGRAEIMDRISPTGPVYQAGTLSGNPVAMAAGIATLERLGDKGIYDDLEAKSSRLAEGMEKAAVDAGVSTFHTRVGSLLCTFFTDSDVYDVESANRCDTELYGRYFHGMQERGFYFAPSQFEAAFVSVAHSQDDIDATISAACEAMQALSGATKTTVSVSGDILEKYDELREFVDSLSKLFFKAEEMMGLTMSGFKKHDRKILEKAEILGKEIHDEEVNLTSSLLERAKTVDSPELKVVLSRLVSKGSHIELIEDNVLKLLMAVRKKVDEAILFSDKAVDELDLLFSSTKDILKSTGDALVTKNRALVQHVLEKEKALSQKALEFEVVHDDRLISGVCAPAASKLYIDMTNAVREINWHVRQVLGKLFML